MRHRPVALLAADVKTAARFDGLNPEGASA